MKYLSVLIILLLQTTPLLAANNTHQKLVEEALKLNLDTHPTWLKLLFYDSIKLKSEVLSDSFFLSDTGRSSPRDELKAILAAYEPVAQSNNSPLCRFPARYLWLSQFLTLPDYTFRQNACVNLESWAKYDEVESISAIMVSGYFGNPASTFGHSLLKFNGPAESRYLDLTFNYGAVVPENENMIRYIWKGIFGGYESGFSDGYFFSQDMVYSRTEFRDMWDYELNLTDFERDLLISHLWEVSGERFDYYFLTKNCAFRLAQILEILEDNNPLTQRSKVWYAPVELFNRIDDLNKLKNYDYIQNITFVPSYQSQLHTKLSDLDHDEVKAFNYFVKNENFDYDYLNEDQRIKVLNALIVYYEFKDVALMNFEDRKYKNLKRKVMLERFLLKPKATDIDKIDALPSPSESSPPMRIAIGGAYDATSSDGFFKLEWSPFHYDSIGLNSLNGGKLVVLNTSININSNNLEIDRLDFIDIRKMPAPKMNISGMYEVAWELNFSLRRNKNDDLKPALEMGLFDGWQQNRFLYLFGINALAWEENDATIHLKPYFEWSYSGDKILGDFKLSRLFSHQNNSDDFEYNLRLNYFFDTKSALGIRINHNSSFKTEVVYQRFL
ncbi:hypothetical protein THIAE_08915 [Thiomicrospira aerophila AL3]|uniref:Uncharacterized protein n=1 Tax=Thiomicrospira aerophila AL3 TaxID=717772 RepID=W0DTB7_9GAMM|nr:DUF4105 domain-containing protein [Thiomicrospira aerophila]AHF01860.1 hypothetical protein THIAE_08915 [Thiomicrospira aerophila AL3]